jgi:precorrin-2 dehydrogenase/sirohydrochlorin ferrochelatase
MFPVTLDLAGRTVVVIGCGPVGRRKAAAAVAAGAGVIVVDPHVDSCASVAAQRWIVEPYRREHLAGAALAFACAPPDVNVRVVADARALGVWVNAASDPGAGDFTLPAALSIGALTIAVSTGGAAPALARRVRDRLAGYFDDSFAEWVALLNDIRGEVFATVADPRHRRDLLDGFAEWAWLERLRAEGIEGVRAAMRERVEAASRAVPPP